MGGKFVTMAKKYRKLKKRKIHYKKQSDRSRVIKTILFIALLLVLVFLAYSVAGPIKEMLSGGLQTPSEPTAPSSISGSQSTTASETVSSQPTAETGIRATVMSIQTALDATKRDAFLAQVKQDGYTAVMVELKDAAGKVWFSSDAVASLCATAVAENGLSAKELAAAIRSAGLTPIASLHIFRDQTAPHKSKDNTFLVTGSNSTWWDNSADKGGKPWLNPHKEVARAYNVTVVGEVAKAGFAQIVLRSVQFPDISYKPRTDMSGTKSTAEILSQFIAEAAAAAEKNGAQVTAAYDSAAYWTPHEISYGGEASAIQAKTLSPILSLADYGAKLTIGETVIENPSQDPQKTVCTVIETIRQKTAQQNPQLIPILSSDDNLEASIAALKTLGIQNYIVE